MRLHLVDGTFELFRAHHSRRPDRTDADGAPVKAVDGLVSSLLALLADEDVTHIAVAFDNPIESFRNRLFAGYKDSTGVPPELLAQFDLAEEAVRALGVAVWSMDEYEADDALMTGARRFADAVEQVRIMTPDKDLAQAVAGRRVVQVDRMRRREFDEDGVVERLGVAPRSVPDYLALVGDSADGIPGIRGFGAKSAAALLRRYGRLEDVPPRGRDWRVDVRGAGALAARLAEQREEALLYRRLATLADDAPVAASLDEVAFRGVPEASFLALCERLDADRLRDRPHRWA